jgi:long-subunit acyl-CoA synthetase (AMP-forming)
MGEAGDPPGCRDGGELIIRGPAVTPGYWNDVEGTLEAKRDGWLHTGIKATKKHFLITLR